MIRLIFCVTCLLFMTSCYNTTVIVGNVKHGEVMVEVDRVWNNGFIAGLVPGKNATMDGSKHTQGRKNYMVITRQNFGTAIISFFTYFIYTPTRTIYYIPLSDLE